MKIARIRTIAAAARAGIDASVGACRFAVRLVAVIAGRRCTILGAWRGLLSWPCVWARRRLGIVLAGILRILIAGGSAGRANGCHVIAIRVVLVAGRSSILRAV